LVPSVSSGWIDLSRYLLYNLINPQERTFQQSLDGANTQKTSETAAPGVIWEDFVYDAETVEKDGFRILNSWAA
jgi:hypothetical protein